MPETFRIIRFSANSHELVVIGTKHVHDSANPLFERIQTLLHDFAARHPDGTVISENACSVADQPTLEEGVARVAEAGAIHWYAHKAGLQVICPEPPYPDVISQLRQHFSPEEVAYTMLRVALEPQTQSGASEEELQKTLDKQIKYWITPEMQKAAGFQPTKEWYRRYKEGDPFSDAVLDAMVKIRDGALLTEVKRLWNKGKSIFLVYGKMHTDRLGVEFKNFIGINPSELK